MRYASPSTVSLGKVLWATLLACCLQISVTVVADDLTAAKSGDESLQDGLRRHWDRIHGGWEIRSSLPFNDQMGYSTPEREKRAWKNLQGAWGKRYTPSEEDLTIQELASILEQQDSREAPPLDGDNDFNIHEDKRAWDKFVDGWGKRNNKWEKFRGSWGKREPAWSNLKGIWGKRSLYQYAN